MHNITRASSNKKKINHYSSGSEKEKKSNNNFGTIFLIFLHKTNCKEMFLIKYVFSGYKWLSGKKRKDCSSFSHKDNCLFIHVCMANYLILHFSEDLN